jgi:uncharacterized membrane protein
MEEPMPVRALGHPIHQMLIVLPLGMLSGAVIFDILAMVTGSASMSTVAFYMIAAGVVTGLLAAPFGFVDWLGIPAGSRAKSIGAIHGLGNVGVVLLFAASWFMRRTDPLIPTTAALTLSFAGFVVSMVTGWLGGELVDRLGIGVDEGANVNAPSSLTTTSVASPTRRPAA